MSGAEILDDSAGGRVFVGRDRELRELLAGFAGAAGGHGRMFMVVGEPGIGKTRLALELAARAALQGARLLWGRCVEGGGAPVYWPWVQVLRGYLRANAREALPPQLQHFLPELRAREAPPHDAAPESEDARFQLFDALTAFLRAAGAQQPLVLVLDDLHAADQPSLLLLQFAARELRDLRLLMIGTYREYEVRRVGWRAGLLGELARESQRVPLRGLSAADVGHFISQTARYTPPAALVAAVHQATEGNPFFVDEVIRLLVAEGRLQRPEQAMVGSFRVPDAVRETIHRRLDPLSTEVRNVLDVASVSGREFDHAPLQRVCGWSAPRLLEILAAAADAGIVIEVAGMAGRHAFAHALLRETLYDDLSATRRLQLHRQIGEACEELYRSQLELHLEKLAHHFLQAAPAGDVDKAVDYATRAGRHAQALLAYEDAAQWFDSALQALRLTAPDDAQRCKLLLALGDAQHRAGESAKARASFDEAARLARALGVPRWLGRAAVGIALTGAETGVVDEHLVRVLDEALAALPAEDSVLRATVLGRLAVALYFSNAAERRATLSQQAVDMARRLGDTAAVAAALMTRHFVLWGPGTVDERLGVAGELVRLGERAGDPDIVLEGRDWRIVDLLERGDIVAAHAETAAFARLADERRLPRYRWHAVLLRGMFALFEGRFTEAETLVQQALTFGQRSEVQNAVQFFGVQTFLLRREQGRLAELETGVRGFVEQYPALPIWRCGLATLYGELGRVDDARREFERLAAHGFSDLPEDANWLPAAALLAEVCATVGDASRASKLYELLRPHAERNVVIATGVACYGSVSQSLGRLATTMARWDAAARHFEDAIAANSRMGATPWVANCQLEYARMLLAADRAEQAPGLLQAALASARQLGMTALTTRALAVGEVLAGQRAGQRNDGGRPTADLPGARNVFRKEGDYWTIAFDGSVFRLAQTKGLVYIAHLLRHPTRAFHVGDLQQLTASVGAAQVPWRRQLDALREQLDEAQRFNDLGRVDRIRRRIDRCMHVLTGEAALGSQDRAAARVAERTRVAVSKAIAIAFRTIGAHSPELRRYLATTIKTGRFCSYTPDPRLPVRWDLSR